MLYKILMIAAALLGILQFTTIQDRFARVILAALIISIALTLVPQETVVQAGFILYSLSVLLAVVYGFTKTGLDLKTRVLLELICIPVLLVNIFAQAGWPYVTELSLLMIVPVVAFVMLVLSNISKNKTEIVFLTIIAVDAAVKLSMAIEWKFIN